MFHVVVRRSGPEYDLSRPLEEQSGWSEHASFMDGLVDAGFIVLGGPLADEERVVHAVEAESEDAVRATLARDPWSGTHLVIDTIDPWTIRLDARLAKPLLVQDATAQLLEVDVAAAEHADDLRAGLRLDAPREQRRDGGGRCALDDQLAARHRPQHRVEDHARRRS